MQPADSKPGNYYVTARDAGRTAFLAGPFRDNHAAALALVDRVSAAAIKTDARAVFWSFGTTRAPHSFNRPGALNAALGL